MVEVVKFIYIYFHYLKNNNIEIGGQGGRGGKGGYQYSWKEFDK